MHDAHVREYRRFAKLVLVKGAIERGEVAHTRMRRIGGPVVCVYGRDVNSPTGVTCLAILDDDSETASILRGGLSPLSPTEGFA